MFSTRQLVQSALIAATVAAAAPVHADASFATGGYARFASGARSGHLDAGSPVSANPGSSFATGGDGRIVAESSGAPAAAPLATRATPQPSFATGGYAREIVGEGSREPGVYRIAGYPWDNGGYKSDGWRAPESRG
jgi:hypothetical protein